MKVLTKILCIDCGSDSALSEVQIIPGMNLVLCENDIIRREYREEELKKEDYEQPLA